MTVSPRGRFLMLERMNSFGGWASGLSIGVLSKLMGDSPQGLSPLIRLTLSLLGQELLF